MSRISFSWPIAGAAPCGRPSGCRLENEPGQEARASAPDGRAHGGRGAKKQASRIGLWRGRGGARGQPRNRGRARKFQKFHLPKGKKTSPPQPAKGPKGRGGDGGWGECVPGGESRASGAPAGGRDCESNAKLCLGVRNITETEYCRKGLACTASGMLVAERGTATSAAFNRLGPPLIRVPIESLVASGDWAYSTADAKHVPSPVQPGGYNPGSLGNSVYERQMPRT